MNPEYKEELEESFVSLYFEMGDDDETNLTNINKAKALVAEYSQKANAIVEALEDGVAFDMSDAILTIQTLHFAVMYLRQMEH